MRFAYRPSGGSWTNTPWEDRSGSGSYDKIITILSPNTLYFFKAQLEYDSIVIEGAAEKLFTTGISGMWHFDEGSGSIAHDSSGNGNNGTIYDATWTSGISGSALSFDGIDDYVEIPDSDSLDITGAITVEAWMNSLGNVSIGDIPNITETAEFDAIKGKTPDIIHVSGDVYAIAYSGDGDDGTLKTVEIAANGQITDLPYTLEFDPAKGKDPNIIHISGNVYAIAYSGDGDDGYVKTVRIVTTRGIFKAGSYGIDANTTTAFATINDLTISAAISSGWNHIVLTYNKNAGSNQLKLYINGEEKANETLTDAITTNANDLIIGQYFNGIIDEVAIYGWALSREDVLEHYNATKP